MRAYVNSARLRMLVVSWAVLPTFFCQPVFGETTVEDGFSRAKEGRVIDAETRKPIADAWVVARWLHGGYSAAEGSSRSGCRYSLTVRTDAQGFYHIPDTSKDVATESGQGTQLHDAYKWSVIAYAPGHFREADFNTSVLRDATTGAEPLKLKAMLSPALFTAEPAEHPAVVGNDASGQHLADIVLTARALPPALKVLYLENLFERSQCRTPQDQAFARAAYTEAHQVACANNPTFMGAQFGLANLWSAVSSAAHTPANADALRQLNDKAYFNHHEYLTDDRKLLCGLTQPDSGGAQ